MRLLLLSDTHGQNDLLKDMPHADVLIHCGDVTRYGNRGGLRDFALAFSQHPAPHKLVIAGNHDTCFSKHRDQCRDILHSVGITYLQDEGVTINGIKFWGMPWVLRFGMWSFMLSEAGMREKLEIIPEDTDVLITHGPPNSIFDRTEDGEYVGSHEQAFFTAQIIRPTLSVFGHIHESYAGPLSMNGVNYVNCSLLNERYVPTNKPVEYEI